MSLINIGLNGSWKMRFPHQLCTVITMVYSSTYNLNAGHFRYCRSKHRRYRLTILARPPRTAFLWYIRRRWTRKSRDFRDRYPLRNIVRTQQDCFVKYGKFDAGRNCNYYASVFHSNLRNLRGLSCERNKCNASQDPARETRQRMNCVGWHYFFF